MNCYILNYPAPVLNMMDRRKSYPVGKEAEGNDIEFVVSAYYSGASPDTPTSDLVSGGLQEFNLNLHQPHHSHFNQYRSTSSLSSNSGQSSRRQSFSSTTSNSTWNDGSGTSTANNCCGSSYHSAGTTRQQLASESLPHHCVSLLRARLLNMSQKNEETEDVDTPHTQNKHYESDAKALGTSVSYEDDSRRQRSNSMSAGVVAREDYPCVGPFEKKRRLLAREKRLSETQTTPIRDEEQSGVKPINEVGAQYPAELLFENSTISQQDGPINLCKHDEEIAANLQTECYMQECASDVQRCGIHSEAHGRTLLSEVEALCGPTENPSPSSETFASAPGSLGAASPIYAQNLFQHSEALNATKIRSYCHPELGNANPNLEDKLYHRSESRESGQETIPEYESHLSPQGSQHSCGSGNGSRPRSTNSFHQFLNSPLPHPEIVEEEEYFQPTSRIVFELGEPNSSALAHLQMLAHVETDEKVSGVSNFPHLPEVEFRKRSFTQPDDLLTHRIKATELVPIPRTQRRQSVHSGIRTAAERKMITADEVKEAPKVQDFAKLISLPPSKPDLSFLSQEFEFTRPFPPECASLVAPSIQDSRRIAKKETATFAGNFGMDAIKIHKSRPQINDFNDIEIPHIKHEHMSCNDIEIPRVKYEQMSCTFDTFQANVAQFEPMDEQVEAISILQSRSHSANKFKSQAQPVKLAIEDHALKKSSKSGKKAPKKVLQCPDCPKFFSQLRNFRYHRSRHEGTDLFQCTCPVCGKKFNDKGYLSSHLKIHSNKKEYQCEYCEKNFNQRVAYNMHVRIHTGVKPHQCTYCEKAFSRKMLLRQHLRTHTGERPYSCAICSKAFADRSNMLLHQKLHSGNRPYACAQCDKTFSKNHHLKTHLNHHLGIKPYSCSNCGHTFSQSSNMKTHMKKCCTKDADKAKVNVKPPTVRAVRTPVPGKAAAPAPPKKRLNKNIDVGNSEPKNVVKVEELKTFQRAPGPDTYETLNPVPKPLDDFRQRAASIDSSIKRPTVIRSLDYTCLTPHHNSELAERSEWKRPEEQYAKSLQDLNQTYAMHHRMSFPIEAFPPPRHMLMARRFSDLSNTSTTTGRMSCKAGHTTSLANSMDRFLHAQMMAHGHSLGQTFAEHVSPRPHQSPPNCNQVSAHHQNFQDYVKAHPNIQEDHYATCVQKLKMLELYRQAPAASPDENQRERSQSFDQSGSQIDIDHNLQQTINHESQLKRPRSRSPPLPFPMDIGEEVVSHKHNFPISETGDMKPRVRSYSDCHKHRRQQK